MASRGAVPARVRRIGSVILALSGALLIGTAASAAADALPEIQATAGSEVQLPAPGWGELAYKAPEPGSYRLPPLGDARDGAVLDSSGRVRSLHEVFDGRIVLLAFIYSACSDINGCPLAMAVMHGLFTEMRADPRLGSNLRLVSLSFDPRHDTPQRLRLYRNGLAGVDAGDDWQFLTTASNTELQPILAGYGQAVQVGLDADGAQGSNFAHVLRVFLIDPKRRIRNIYSSSFLHRDLVLSDIGTLLLEDDPAAHLAGASASPDGLTGAGDYKVGYETSDYETRSRSLRNRQGDPADLLGLATDTPLGLPPVPVPSDNPLTAAKIELGRKLFFDRRLSLNDTFSCAMCHIPEQGFTSNEMATAVGIEGRTVRRNSPTLFNVAYAERLFHDGRESRLEQQVWSPLLARNEMGNPSIGALLEKLERLPDYAGRFEAVFGRGPGMDTLGMALASYERTLLAGDSPFDRWYFGGQADALSEAARRGFDLFRGQAGCIACHSIGSDHALFSDQRLHNTGIGYRRAMGDRAEPRTVLVAPGTSLEIAGSVIAAVGEPQPGDMGLYEVTQNPADRWKYRTPTLRNIALTAPYMHDGSMPTLHDVVDHYDRGGVRNEDLSPLLRPLGLTPEEKSDLVAFLGALTGSAVERLVADAFAAKVGDLTRGDPHWTHRGGDRLP